MDDDALNMRNWGYYEQSFKGQNLGLQLMSNVTDRETKPFIPGRDFNSLFIGGNGPFHQRGDYLVPDPSLHMSYMSDGWINHREKFFNPQNPNYVVFSDTSRAHLLQNLQLPDNNSVESLSGVEEEASLRKKRHEEGARPKAKKPRKPKDTTSNAVQRFKPPKKSVDLVINGINMDVSGMPIPVCSCTGNPQQCYRWGCGGWQSACCTTNVSVYPLPMSTKRRGARIAGRKMSQGAFKKVLEKLAAEGYNFANPIDLRTHWARHGSNKFVTIR